MKHITIFVILVICTSLFTACEERKNVSSNLMLAIENKGVNNVVKEDSLNYKKGLNNFLEKLNEIINTKNFKDLITILSPNVVVSYGEALYGVKEFKKYWGSETEQSVLWSKLLQLIQYGGTSINEEKYIFPYFLNPNFTDSIPIDCFELAYCVNEEVKIFDSDLENEIGKLGQEMVQIVDRSKQDFFKIKKINNSIEGWVSKSNLYECTDYSLILEQNDSGKWEIKSFSNG